MPKSDNKQVKLNVKIKKDEKLIDKILRHYQSGKSCDCFGWYNG